MKILIGLLFLFAPVASSAKYYKKKDGDYKREICDLKQGDRKTILPNGDKPDCKTSTHVIEVDSAEDWEENLHQAMRYGRGSNLKPILILVLEQESQQEFAEEAKQKIESEGLQVELETYSNFSSAEQSLNEIVGPIVKKSKTDFCHVKNCGMYAETNEVESFETLETCLKSGGKVPGNIKKATLERCERDAIAASLVPKIPSAPSELHSIQINHKASEEKIAESSEHLKRIEHLEAKVKALEAKVESLIENQRPQPEG